MSNNPIISGQEVLLASPVKIPKHHIIGREEELSLCATAWGASFEVGKLQNQGKTHLNFCLQGRSGVGKSHIVYEIARRLNKDLYVMLGHGDLGPDELALTLTPMTAENGLVKYNLRASPLATAIYTGSLFYFDQINRVSKRTLSALASVLDERRNIYSSLIGITINSKTQNERESFRFCCSVDFNKDTLHDALPDYIAQRCVPVIHVNALTSEKLLKVVGPGQRPKKRDMNLFQARFIEKNKYHVSLNNLSNFAAYMENTPKASANDLNEKILQLLLIREKSYGEDHPSVQRSTLELAYFFKSKENYSLAAELFRKIIAWEEKQTEQNSTKVLRFKISLVDTLKIGGQLAEAESEAIQLLSDIEASSDSDRIFLSNVLNQSGIIARRLGYYNKAVDYYNRSMRIDKERSSINQSKIANTTGNLGLAYWYIGRYKEAESCLVQSLGGPEVEYESASFDDTSHLRNLAHVYRTMGRYLEAKKLYDIVFTLEEEHLSKNHSQQAYTLNGLAILSLYTDQLEEAKQLAEQALYIRKEALGENHHLVAESLHTKGMVHYWSNELTQASTYFEQALYLKKQVMHGKHPEIALSMSALGAVLADQGEIKKAKKLIKEALHLLEDEFTDDQPQILDVKFSKCKLYIAQGKNDNAQALLKKIIKAQKDLFGSENHLDVQRSLKMLRDITL